ncbi:MULTISPECIES: hypothetical protein [Bacillus cereus group]|uniref:hypothetical protein n=1 Tax=Bacillus cereus group TaxID=86661 RepID=UPI001EE0FACB|nr:hypothetical protein [Bacillus thuringiensis]MCG3426008.1 hypothetical protein [Bacillus thuringiensis]
MEDYDFFAPEQVEKGVILAPSMDIYTLGKVCQWYVFEYTHKETNRKITDVLNSNQTKIIETVAVKGKWSK